MQKLKFGTQIGEKCGHVSTLKERLYDFDLISLFLEYKSDLRPPPGGRAVCSPKSHAPLLLRQADAGLVLLFGRNLGY